jgi:2-polyprenyl-6-methoxyphenol hydroxylase-like FAD-dependent oxidoreductase
MNRKAVIIGGGIAGLSAGIALRDAGWDIALYEQAPQLTAMGAALSIWPNAVAALDRLGCGEVLRNMAPRLDQFGVSLASGTPVFLQNVGKVAAGQTAYLPSRTLLQQILLEQLGDDAIRFDHQLDGFNSTPGGVEVSFSNGHVAQGDLLIAADGIWSKIAQSVIGNTPIHTGYGGMLGMCPPLAAWPDTATGVEYWGRGERMGLFDHGVAGKYWFYMHNQHKDQSMGSLTTKAIARQVQGWPPALKAAVEATPPSGLTPFSVHAKPPPNRLGAGRIICVGDAAHAMEPNLGQGACQALEDAVALGMAAKELNLHAILPAFERRRLKRVRKFVKMSAQGSLVMHRFPALVSLFQLAPVRAIFRRSVRAQLGGLFRSS